MDKKEWDVFPLTNQDSYPGEHQAYDLRANVSKTDFEQASLTIHRIDKPDGLRTLFDFTIGVPENGSAAFLTDPEGGLHLQVRFKGEWEIGHFLAALTKTVEALQAKGFKKITYE